MAPKWKIARVVTCNAGLKLTASLCTESKTIKYEMENERVANSYLHCNGMKLTDSLCNQGTQNKNHQLQKVFS